MIESLYQRKRKVGYIKIDFITELTIINTYSVSDPIFNPKSA